MADGTEATETSILETPPYFIAALLATFLVITLGFEKVSAQQPSATVTTGSTRYDYTQILHWGKARLARARKHGLVVR